MLKTILEETFGSPKQGGILGSWPPRRALAKGRLERAQTGVVPGPGDEPNLLSAASEASQQVRAA